MASASFFAYTCKSLHTFHDFMKSEFRPHPWRPLAALLLPLAASAIHGLTWMSFHPHVWLPLYYPAVFFAAWIGGFEWGILATAGSVALAWWSFGLNGFPQQMGTASLLLSLGVFAAMGVAFSVLLERMHAARARAEADCREMRDQDGLQFQFLSDLMDKVHDGEIRTVRLFQHMNSGFARCRLVFRGGSPVDFEYLEINPAFGRLTGLQAVVGRRMSEVHPTLAGDNPELLAALGRVAAQGVSESAEVFLKSRDAWYSTNLYCPVPGEFIALFEETTARKRAERALHDATRRLELATRAAQLGTWEYEPGTGRTSWDGRTRELYGATREEAVDGMATCLKRLHPEDRAAALAVFQAALEGDGDYHHQYRIILPDGQIRFLVVDAAIERGPDGRALRLAGLIREVPALVIAAAAEAMTREKVSV